MLQVKLTNAKDRQDVLEEQNFPIDNSREWNHSVKFDVPSPMCILLVEFCQMVKGKEHKHKNKHKKEPYGKLQDLLPATDLVQWYARRAALPPTLAIVCLLAVVRAHLVLCLLQGSPA